MAILVLYISARGNNRRHAITVVLPSTDEMSKYFQ